jgi:hypothetical protein
MILYITKPAEVLHSAGFVINDFDSFNSELRTPDYH